MTGSKRNSYGLTPKQEDFALGLASGLSQAAAYRKAYPAALKWADATVWREASLLAANPKVSTRVQDLLDRAAKSHEVTVERVMMELARLAFFDIRKLVGDDGRPLPLQQLDDDTARALVGLEVVPIGNDQVGVGEVLKFKLADKKGALELLGRRLGMFNDKLQLSNPDGSPLAPTVVRIVGKKPAEVGK
jgi:phage terminase small subunit